MADSVDVPTPSLGLNVNVNVNLNSLLHPRREPFEYGLLPIFKLAFADPVRTLITLKQKIICQSPVHRVDSSSLADLLQIPIDHADLILHTLASVLPTEHDPLLADSAAGANVYDLVLFLYVQSYKKLVPKMHKDSAAVADVWPSTSPFDGCVSALSPLQLVRSNSRRFVLSLAHEEAHQLSYLQKHLANLVSLLAEPVDGEGEESLVITVERFEHLGLLVHFGDGVSERIPLSQATPLFASSDPNAPPVPVPATQVHDWVLGKISSSLEYISERVPLKDSSSPSNSDKDVVMEDSGAVKPCITYIEGIYKSSVVKQSADCTDPTVKVLNCHDSVIYILAPLKYATVHGCSDATIVLGAVGKAVKIEHCERVHVIVAARRVCIANCRECVFFLGVNQRPLIVGENYKVQVAPYNTFYPQLEEHMNEVGIMATVNRWNDPLSLGMLDPHDSLSHPAGISDAQPVPATYLAPDQFTNFLIPTFVGAESTGPTKCNPFSLPEAYMTSQQEKQKTARDIKQMLREAPLEENRKQELSSALHTHFKDWLYASGNVRQLYSLQGQ